MPQRFTNPAIKYTTDTLKTLPGALLYFYENGTSTPKVVYQDIELTIPHAHPVEALDNGVFPPIFLDGTYRAELKSAAGVTQSGWPIDDIGGEEIQGQFDDWSSITNYQVGALVTAPNGLRYQSLQTPNLNQEPSISPAYWEEVRLSEEYNALSTYAVGDWVLYLGNWYKCKVIATGQTPSASSAYWDAEKVVFQWNSTTTYADDAHIFVGEDEYVSQQAANLNHNPAGDSAYTWWKPQARVYLEANPQLIKINECSGGGEIKAEWNNDLTDSDTYDLPLANSVPDNTVLYASVSDTNRTETPIVQRSGSDLILWSGGTDTSFRFNYGYARTRKFTSNGVDRWSI